MKDVYFEKETLSETATAMAETLRPLIRPRRCPFDSTRSALLVLDMQRQFLDPSSHAFIPSAPAIIPGINRLIATFRRNGRPVILTRHVNSAENAGSMARWWSHIVTAADPAGQLDPSVDPLDATIMIKSKYDAFIETALLDILNDAGVVSVLITGVMTHICCDTTARSAFQHGFDVFIAVDGTATYTRALHEASLLTLAHCCARPVLGETVFNGR